jgi:hypothetical protein
LDLRVPYSERARLEPSGRLTCNVWTAGDEADTLTRVVRFGAVPWAHRPAIASFGSPRRRSVQPVVLTGRLIDAYDGDPLKGARVQLIDLHLLTTTDAEGEFTLSAHSPPGCLWVLADRIGYDPTEGLIRIDGPTERDLGDVPLQPAMSGPATHPIPSAQDGCVPSSPAWPRHFVRFGSVTGRLLGASGRPNQDVRLRVACGRYASSDAITDENGTFIADIALSPETADSVETARSWTCYLGSTPVRVPLHRDMLRVTPVVLDHGAPDGRRR